MKTRNKILLGTLVAGLAVGSVYVATGAADPYRGWHGRGGPHGAMMPGGTHGGRMTMMFDQLDLDGDGTVTKAELDRFRTQGLERHDADDDGNLTLEEFQPFFAEVTRPMMVRAFQFFDADGDGQVTSEELARPTDRMFERMDRDGDGVLKPVDCARREGARRGEGHDD